LQPSTLAKRVYILLFLAIIAFYLYGLGMLPLVGPDEPRYAQVAREMFLRGDPVTPTLGGHTWFEKPALLYWMMMVAYQFFGVSEFSARLGPAICGLLTILAVWVLGRELSRSTSDDELHSLEGWSALALATSLGMIVFSRAASFDIVVTMTIAWSLVFFALCELAVSPKKRKLLLAGFYGSIGLSLLAKGLIGLVLPFAVVGLYFLARRRKPPRDLVTSLLWGLPLVLIVAATWYGPVIARHGWVFIDEFFIQHHFARYVSNKYKHPQPLYFYPAITILLTLPWTPFLVDSLLRIRSWKWRDANSVSRFRVLAFCWMIFPIIFFSFSGSKLPGYILPVLPAVAILVGERIARFCGDTDSPKWLPVTMGLVVLTLSISGVTYAVLTGRRPLLAFFLTLPLFISGVVAIVFPRWRCNAMILIAGGLLLTLTGVVQFVAHSRASRESVKELLRLADAQGYSQAPVFARRGSDRTAEFYASGRVVYDADGEPVELEEPPYLIAEARRRGERILVLVPVEYLEPYRRSPQLIILAENGNLGLVGVR
jgi:4-amino-4-deoxy-L-arabinose transferase-like glycosyltransferase